MSSAGAIARAGMRNLSHLDWLESEAIHILREVAGQCAHPALLFSGGKDSIVLLHLATKAFRPARFPFPLLHVDTGHNFPEVIEFRDRRAQLRQRCSCRLLERHCPGIRPVQAAFPGSGALPPPASGADVLAYGHGPRAGRTADAGVKAVM